jgi:signal peptidase I
VTRAPRSRRRVLLEYGLTLLLSIAIAYAVEALAVKPFAIPTASMANTVQPGDRLLIDRVSYRLHGVHRGDIIVFGGHGPIPLLKRVVGLPGDRLSLSNGRLFVDGQPSSQAWVRRFDGRREPTLPAPDTFLPWSLAHPYVVPAGQYFVMGDNRTDSDDSRYWGTVTRGQIVGKAFFIYWPPQHMKGL